MKRRDFITLLGGAAAAWPLAAWAQQVGKLPTIGFLGANTPAVQTQWTAAFVQGLRELGWVEGRNVAIEYRWAEGRTERFTEIAAEFVRLKVDVILTHGTPATILAKQTTSVIPIVFTVVGDPVGCHRPCCQPGATGRQHHRPIEPRDRSCFQATRTLSRCCPRSRSIGDLGQCRQCCGRAGTGRDSGNGPQARS